MEYKISDFKVRDVIFEKHMESNGFFRNVSGSSKVGEIAFLDFTEKGIKNYFTENDKVYYMELGSVNGFNFPYRGEASRRFIKNCKNIPAEERIKFLYEALSSNENYNCLAITHKDKRRGTKKLLFELDKWHQETDIVTFSIDDL